MTLEEKKPLTISQLMQMDRQPVFIQDMNEWAIVNIDHRYGSDELAPFVQGASFCYDVEERNIKVHDVEDYYKTRLKNTENAIYQIAVNMIKQQIEMVEMCPACDGLDFSVLCAMCKKDSNVCSDCPNAKSESDCAFCFDENKFEQSFPEK